MGKRGSPIVPADSSRFPPRHAGAGGADERNVLYRITCITSATKPEFSGGSAGMTGSAEAARVFGEGVNVANLHSSRDVRSAASLRRLQNPATPCGASRYCARRENSVFIGTCQLHCGSGRIGSFSTRMIVTSPRMFMFSGNGIQRNSGLIRSDWNEAGASGHRSCLKSRGLYGRIKSGY